MVAATSKKSKREIRAGSRRFELCPTRCLMLDAAARTGRAAMPVPLSGRPVLLEPAGSFRLPNEVRLV